MGDFATGFTDYILTLGSAWVFANVSEHEVSLTRADLNPYFVYSFCFLDAPGVSVQSRVYIKRETHLVEGISIPSELRYVLAAEPRSGELQFAAGTKIVLRVNVSHFIV